MVLASVGSEYVVAELDFDAPGWTAFFAALVAIPRVDAI
jgi:hypothetical protein